MVKLEIVGCAEPDAQIWRSKTLTILLNAVCDF